MIQKHFYEAPEAEILHVKIERRFLADTNKPDGSFSEEKGYMIDKSNENWWGN